MQESQLQKSFEEIVLWSSLGSVFTTLSFSFYILNISSMQSNKYGYTDDSAIVTQD